MNAPVLISFRRWLTAPLACLVILVSLVSTTAQDPEIVVGTTAAKATPIALSGFSGVAESVLKQDLYVIGFEFTSTDRAKYIVSGGVKGSQLEGTLTETVNKHVHFANAYTDASERAQAHRLADDIAKAVLNLPPIGRTRIAFKLDVGRSSEIYVADFDGHNAIKLTEDASIVAAPAWAPGGRNLYYTSYRANNPDVYLHRADGTRTPIARFSGLNTSANVSPDGSRIALILSKSGSPDVWVMGADGSNPKQLTTNREDESSPCWSPDGRTICFSSRETGRAILYTVPASGGKMTKMDIGGIQNATEPDWSPDGSMIAFTRATGGGFQICVVQANGGRGGTVRQICAGEDASWAPNSRTLIFTRRVNNKRVLSLLDVKTSRWKDAAQLSGSCSQPSWAR